VTGDEERVRRIGHNEALYRQVNERIEDISSGFAEITGEFSIVCECGDLACTDQVPVPHDVYERTRATPVRFIVKPGHVIPDVETVIESHAAFSIIEKTAPDARRVAAETDTRD
jgi:hypothetical protein